jgi:4-amino-4-deoxy-L-arabinose transferase-like glycosyltransferase
MGLMHAGPLQEPVLPPVIWQSLPMIRQGGQGFPPEMVAMLEQQRGQARWLLAVTDGPTAGPLIIDTGAPVMAMGGFRGTDPALPAEKLARLVQSGDLRFVLLMPLSSGAESAGPVVDARNAWVRAHCQPLGGGEEQQGEGGEQGQQGQEPGPVLYDCAAR